MEICKGGESAWVLGSEKNSLSFCFSLSFTYYLHAKLRIVILEVWRFIIRQVNNNATSPHCRIKNQSLSHKKSAKLRIDSIWTRKCCWIKNRQTSTCHRFVIRQITQTQTETETDAVRSHAGEGCVNGYILWLSHRKWYKRFHSWNKNRNRLKKETRIVILW